MSDKRRVLDSEGVEVTPGCTVCFTYGIPPVGVRAPVVQRNGKLIAITKGHKPSECEVRQLEEYVGYFYVAGVEK